MDDVIGIHVYLYAMQYKSLSLYPSPMPRLDLAARALRAGGLGMRLIGFVVQGTPFDVWLHTSLDNVCEKHLAGYYNYKYERCFH